MTTYPYPYSSGWDPSEFVPYRYNSVLEGMYGIYTTGAVSDMDCLLGLGISLFGARVFMPDNDGSCDAVRFLVVTRVTGAT